MCWCVDLLRERWCDLWKVSVLQRLDCVSFSMHAVLILIRVERPALKNTVHECTFHLKPNFKQNTNICSDFSDFIIIILNINAFKSSMAGKKAKKKVNVCRITVSLTVLHIFYFYFIFCDCKMHIGYFMLQFIVLTPFLFTTLVSVVSSL